MQSPVIALSSVLMLGACAAAPPAKPQAERPATVQSAPAPQQRQAARAAQGLPVRSLPQAIELCLERNPSLSEADARIRAAEAGLAQARAALWPMVGAELGVLWADAPSTYLFKTIDAGRLAPNTDFNDPGSLSNTEASIGASWNLWRGGRDQRAIEAAELGVNAGLAAESAARNALIGAVASTWLELRATRELAESDDARVRTLEAQLADARARFESGAALKIDVLSLEVRVAQAVERRTRTELGRKLALAALRQLLALEEQTPIEPDDAPLAAPELPASRELARELAAEHRGELEAGRAQYASARARVASADRAWMPRLDLMARVWGDESDISLDLQRLNSQVGLVLSVDAIDGGMRGAGLDGARAELLAADARLRAAELGVAQEVDRSWYALEEASAQLTVAEQAQRAAAEGLELVGKLVATGAATISRYLDAESDHAQARAQLVLARIHVQRAGFELRRATGTLQEVMW